MALKKFRGKYWATVFIEVEFDAVDLADAEEIMDGYPENKADIQFREINGIEERSDFEVEEPLNADVRGLPIEMGKHTVKVDALINVAAGLQWDSGFGEAYLDRFDVRQTPTRIEVCDWLQKKPFYADSVQIEGVDKLLGMMGHIQAEVATAEIKQVAEEHGYHCMVLEVDAQ